MVRPKLETSILQTLTTAARDLAIFTKPTTEQRKARSVFWTHFGTEGVPPPPPLPDLAAALRFGGDSRISKWWDLPGFQQWFWNNEEFKQRLEFIAGLALDTLEEVVGDPTQKTSDRLNAAKMIMEAAGKFPSKKADGGERFLDEKIASMGRQELESFISSNIKRLAPTVVTVEPEDVLTQATPSSDGD